MVGRGSSCGFVADIKQERKYAREKLHTVVKIQKETRTIEIEQSNCTSEICKVLSCCMWEVNNGKFSQYILKSWEGLEKYQRSINKMLSIWKVITHVLHTCDTSISYLWDVQGKGTDIIDSNRNAT